ncbi:MAG: hypothetical protein H0W09_01075 [Solirubrobacterales bacterium]|nr:hypothetical protein [Solirubrobacterales bacterium]
MSCGGEEASERRSSAAATVALFVVNLRLFSRGYKLRGPELPGGAAGRGATAPIRAWNSSSVNG